MRRLLPIVEGDGDLRAVPVLIRRVLAEHGRDEVSVLSAQKRGEYAKLIPNFERWFRSALKENAAVLWVLDFDCDECDCAKREAKKLYQRAEAIYRGWPFKVAFMIQEFETLFLSDQKAARVALKEIGKNVAFPNDPEKIRGAKEWLSKALPKGTSYKPTVHQAKLASAVSLDVLRQRSPSFRHFEKAVLYLSDSTPAR
jgi:hypothetical protein